MKKLSDKEFNIMEILWHNGGAMTSNEILDNADGAFNWKLASLMTVLSRMADKGYVYCDRSTRTNYYTATIAEEEYKLRESESFLDRLFDRSATKFIASLCEKDRISKDEIAELKEYLDSLGEERR